MAQQPLSLTGRALRLLSAREHSRAELERKLAAHEDQPGALARVLDTLQAKGFIDEGRVLEALLHRRAGKLGVGRLRQELQAKGLAPEAVSAALQDLRGTELQRAMAVWKKKYPAPPADASERGRQMRFLAARGFGGDVIRKVLSGAGSDEEGDAFGE